MSLVAARARQHQFVGLRDLAEMVQTIRHSSVKDLTLVLEVVWLQPSGHPSCRERVQC